MLSTAASNALLKTLEEPPDHVRVRARHDRSAEGAAHHPQPDAALRVPAAVRRTSSTDVRALDRRRRRPRRRRRRGRPRRPPGPRLGPRHAVGPRPGRRGRRGAGAQSSPSTRCSRRSQLATRGAAIAAVADAIAQGHDPRVLGEALLGGLRDAFLMSLDVDVPRTWSTPTASGSETGPTGWARPPLTRALEALGCGAGRDAPGRRSPHPARGGAGPDHHRSGGSIARVGRAHRATRACGWRRVVGTAGAIRHPGRRCRAEVARRRGPHAASADCPRRGPPPASWRSAAAGAEPSGSSDGRPAASARGPELARSATRREARREPIAPRPVRRSGAGARPAAPGARPSPADAGPGAPSRRRRGPRRRRAR